MGLLKWAFKRYVKQQVTQGRQFQLYNTYMDIRRAFEDEFTEDNQVTIDHHLREQFELTQFAAKHTTDAPPSEITDERIRELKKQLDDEGKIGLIAFARAILNEVGMK